MLVKKDRLTFISVCVYPPEEGKGVQANTEKQMERKLKPPIILPPTTNP